MRDDPKARQLFEEVFQKTSHGRIQWEATAEENLFIAPIGGQFTLAVSHHRGGDRWGEEYDYVSLKLKDKERELISVTSEVEDVPDIQLRELYEIARRQANKVDDKIDKVLNELGKL